MKKLFLAGLVALNVYAGCWDSKASSNIEMDELDDTLTLSFKSAVDCSNIDNANVTIIINGKSVHTKTDDEGLLKIPAFVLKGINDGHLTLKVRKAHYIPYKINLDILLGTIWKKKFLLSPKLTPDSMRFVLSWDKDPRDLDIHLIADNYHISYRNKRSIDGVAKLDQDATHGYGAETITLDRVDPNTTYKLYVHKYSGMGGIDNKAKVAVYVDNQLDRIISLTNSNKAVEVLEMHNGNLQYINRATTLPTNRR